MSTSSRSSIILRSSPVVAMAHTPILFIRTCVVRPTSIPYIGHPPLVEPLCQMIIVYRQRKQNNNIVEKYCPSLLKDTFVPGNISHRITIDSPNRPSANKVAPTSATVHTTLHFSLLVRHRS